MITVVTPFSRIENKEYLIKVLEGKCNWVILQAEGEPDYDFPSWVTVKRYKAQQPSLSNQLLSSFFKEAEDNVQYMVLCDDDSVEEGFFAKIPDKDVVCVSMQRGDTETQHAVWDNWQKKEGHHEVGIDLLYASPLNMKPACVGGEQLIVKGKILKHHSYSMEDSSADVPGDFKFIQDVIKDNEVTYVPDAKVYFNYFEDGRWKAFRRKPIVLFVGDFYCAGSPAMGKSEWEGNLWASLESTELADVARFHMDKYYYHTGKRGDEALLERIKDIKPDYTVLIIYKQPSQDPTVVSLETIKQLPNLITIWGDLEADEQVELLGQIKPYCKMFVGTANKAIVENLGGVYMHVPKDPRIFNNPNKERDIDVVFSGSFGYGREERTAVLQYLLDNGVKLVCGGSEGGDHFTTEEYADRYKRAKIAISFSQARGKNVVNARPFEAMSCGAMLLEQESPELAKLYEEGVDYRSWTDKESLLENIRYFLIHEMERVSVAFSGYTTTKNKYSAKTFWEQIIK